jgi:hypothetical protein
MTNPQSWGHYRRLVADYGLAENPGLNRFAARYRMSHGFRGVDLIGVSEATKSGFESGLRLTLAYSALETLESALPSDPPRTRIADRALAGRLRNPSNRKLAELILEDRDSSKARKLAERIDVVMSGGDDDLRPVVEKVRHLVAHGVFTAHGSGLASSAKRRLLIDDLADATLGASDERFTAWVNSIRP